MRNMSPYTVVRYMWKPVIPVSLKNRSLIPVTRIIVHSLVILSDTFFVIFKNDLAYNINNFKKLIKNLIGLQKIFAALEKRCFTRLTPSFCDWYTSLRVRIPNECPFMARFHQFFSQKISSKMCWDIWCVCLGFKVFVNFIINIFFVFIIF